MSNVTKIKAMIIDDEPLAHEVLLHHLNAINSKNDCSHLRNEQHVEVGDAVLGIKIDVVYRGYSAVDALKYLASKEVDVIFLDINMPELSGLELIKVIINRPQIVLVTAYQEYAVEGFELEVTDYLLKPVSESRLNQAITKVAKKHLQKPTYSVAETLQKPVSHIVLPLSGSKRKVAIDDICWLQAYGNYVKVWLEDEMLLVSSSFKNILMELPSFQNEKDDRLLDAAESAFLQIHKSNAVNILNIRQVNLESVVLGNGTEVKIGKTFKKEIKSLI